MEADVTSKKRIESNIWYKYVLNKQLTDSFMRFITDSDFYNLKSDCFALLPRIEKVPSKVYPVHITIIPDILVCQCDLCVTTRPDAMKEIEKLYEETKDSFPTSEIITHIDPLYQLNGYVELTASLTFRKRNNVPYLSITSSGTCTLIKKIFIRITLEYIRFLSQHTMNFMQARYLLELIRFYKSEFKKSSCSKTLPVVGRLERYAEYIISEGAIVPLCATSKSEKDGHILRMKGSWISNFQLFSVDHKTTIIEVTNENYDSSYLQIRIPTICFAHLAIITVSTK